MANIGPGFDFIAHTPGPPEGPVGSWAAATTTATVAWPLGFSKTGWPAQPERNPATGSADRLGFPKTSIFGKP